MGVAFKFVELGAGGDVPDYDRCVCAAGDEDRLAVEGGGEDAFDEIRVTGEFPPGLLAWIGEGDGVDGFIPASGEEGSGLRADCQTC